MEYLADRIRNVAVLGHQSAGKTHLVAALLGTDGAGNGGKTGRAGAEEATRSLAVAPVFHLEHKLNMIDVPGNDDFLFETIGVTRFVSGALLVLDAGKGVEVETVKHDSIIRKKHVPAIFFLNKMDRDEADFDAALDAIRKKLNRKALVFTCPIGKGAGFKGYVDPLAMKAHVLVGGAMKEAPIPEDMQADMQAIHDAILEQVALTDDALLDKYFAGEPLTPEEIHSSLRKGVLAGEFVPVLAGSAEAGIGLDALLQTIIDFLPSPADIAPASGKGMDNHPVERRPADDESFSAYVFKTTYNAYNGITNIVRIISGTLSLGDEVYCSGTGNTQTIGSMAMLTLEKRDPVTKVHAGDIVALNKLDDVRTGETLSTKKNVIVYDPAAYPTAVFYQAVKAKSKSDEERLGTSLSRIRLEDPTLETKRNNETKQFLLGGTSETHVAYVIEKLKSAYNVTLTTEPRKIVYRETIKVAAEAEGRYVKQSGGSGFYGVVVMRFEPNPEGTDNVFTEQIFGGSVPKNYFPAVEKGFRESLSEGALAGFPVIGVKATLLDGKYHPVDSNEQAFKMAAIMALRAAYPKCKPTILEPIIDMKIHVLQEFVGNVLNDLSNRRARIVSMEDSAEGTTAIRALVPEAEIIDYVSKLRTLTQGSGYYSIRFDSYKEVPGQLIDSVLRDNAIKKQA